MSAPGKSGPYIPVPPVLRKKGPSIPKSGPYIPTPSKVNPRPKIAHKSAPAPKPAPKKHKPAPAPKHKPAPKHTPSVPSRVKDRKAKKKAAAPQTQSQADLAIATRTIDLRQNPTINALLAQQAASKNSVIDQQNAINKKSARTQSDLSNIYSHLDGYLKGQAQQQSNVFDQTNQGINAGYNALQTKLGQNGQNAQGNAQSELDRLGINGAGVNTQGIQSQQGLLQGLAGVDQQNAAAAGASGQTNAGMIQSLLQGNASTQGGVDKASGLRSAMDALTGAQRVGAADQAGILSKLTDVKGQRGSLIQQMMDTIAQNRYQQQMDQQQQRFENQMAGNKQNLAVGALQERSSNDQASQQLGQARLNETRSNHAQQARDKAAARSQKAELAAQKAVATKYAQDHPKAGPYNPRGISGALDYIHRAAGADVNTSSKMSDIMRHVQTGGAASSKTGIQYDPTNYGDYRKMILDINKRLQMGGIDSTHNRAIMADALSAFFSKYGGK